MQPLRHLSARPEILVDNQGVRLIDPDNGRIGTPGPFGRERIVTALATNESGTGPRQIAPAAVMHDNAGFYLADPNGNLLGVTALTIHRMLSARWTQDTRRLP
jgi:hypothetical protein